MNEYIERYKKKIDCLTKIPEKNLHKEQKEEIIEEDEE